MITPAFIRFVIVFSMAFAAGLNACVDRSASVSDPKKIKAEIERLLAIQDSVYDHQSPESLRRLASTCDDSLMFVGGDDGGLLISAQAYTHDLADGYSQKPYKRYFRIYENTVIVTGLQQAYKLLSADTLFLNSRSTKVFVRDGSTWKMAFVTYAPLPVIYSERYTGPTKKFSDYNGIYSLGHSIEDSVFAENGKLYSSVAGSEKSELVAINDSTFIGEGYFGKAVFSRNRKKEITHYYFEWPDGQRIVFPKIR